MQGLGRWLHLACEHQGLSLTHRIHIKKLGMVAYACSSSTGTGDSEPEATGQPHDTQPQLS